MSTCEHGAKPGECADDGCLYRREVKNALLVLAGSVTAAADQAQAMTDAELGTLLTTGRWTTIEVHEAGRRLLARADVGEALLACNSERLSAEADRDRLAAENEKLRRAVNAALCNESEWWVKASEALAQAPQEQP